MNMLLLYLAIVSMAKTFERQLHSVNHFVLRRFSSQDTETKKNIDMVSRSAPLRRASS